MRARSVSLETSFAVPPLPGLTSRNALWLCAVLACLVASACQYSSDPAQECIPGESIACACADGRGGALVCAESGYFAPCARDGVRCVGLGPEGDDTGTLSDVGEQHDSRLSDGRVHQDTSQAQDVPPGPTVACPYPRTTAKAILEEGLGATPKDTFPLTFYGDGALSTMDGRSCTLVGPDHTAVRCQEVYDCGGACRMVLSRYNATGGWNLVPEAPGTGCSDYDAFYTFCTSDCSGKQCGSDGCDGLCGLCDSKWDCEDFVCVDKRSPCDLCISECLEYPVATRPNCCTCGPSCFCGAECASLCAP